MPRKIKARNKIKRMSDKDLRKLRNNLEKTWWRVSKQERQVRTFLKDVQHSREELFRLERRTKYYRQEQGNAMPSIWEWRPIQFRV